MTKTSEKVNTLEVITEKRYRTFQAVYHGPTNTKGSRVTIKDLRRKASVTVPYDYQFNNSEDIARSYLLTRGIKITALAMLNNECLLLSEDFNTNLK